MQSEENDEFLQFDQGLRRLIQNRFSRELWKELLFIYGRVSVFDYEMVFVTDEVQRSEDSVIY